MSVITLSNTTQGRLNRPTNPYLRIQNIPTIIKIRKLWDRQNRTMFDKPSQDIVKSLLVLFFMVITVLVTLIIKEIRSSITEYNKHCTLNCKIDVVWSEIYFIFREKYSHGTVAVLQQRYYYYTVLSTHPFNLIWSFLSFFVLSSC